MGIYLDNASSTLPEKNVIRKIDELLKFYGNPSSLHEEGQLAKNVINNANKIISKAINCSEDAIYYTSGATMSNNMAIQGFLRTYPNAQIVISKVEHEDILLLADWIDKQKDYLNVARIGVDENGFLDLKALNNICCKSNFLGRPILCSIQMANSETGVIQNIKKISDIVHSYGNAYLHTDATQYIPYYAVNVKDMNIDMLSMSGQKINCIKGVGLLYVNPRIKLTPLLFGEQGLIGGTENVLGIGCLGEAFSNLDYSSYKSLLKKRNYAISVIENEMDIPYYFVGDFKNRLPNNIYMCIPNVNAEQLVILMSEFGYYISSGSACSSGHNKPSNVALAYGLSEDDAKSCVRLSLDKDISYENISEAIRILGVLSKMLNSK